jgi:hypothetical protein
MRRLSRSSRCLPSKKATRRLFRAPVERCRRWPAGAVAARFHRCSKEPRLDPCSTALRGRLQGRMRFHDFCRWMSPRARPWTTGTSQTAGEGRWDDCHFESKVSLRIRAIAEGAQGQGPRRYRISALPTVIAHDGDFAPTPIASGASCRGHGSLPLSGATWGENDAAFAACTCKVRATRGSCDASLPRRRRTLTNPRCLPSQGRPRCGLCAPVRPAGAARSSRLRFFHHRGARDEGHSHGT